MIYFKYSYQTENIFSKISHLILLYFFKNSYQIVLFRNFRCLFSRIFYFFNSYFFVKKIKNCKTNQWKTGYKKSNMTDAYVNV